MSNTIDIFLLNDSNTTIEEANIIKPKTFNQLLDIIKKTLQKLPENFKLFQFSENNNEIIINNDEKYKLIKDILFIRESKENILEQSLYEKNYNKLSESKQLIFDEKYSCFICSSNIKNESPFFCYDCQKVYHEICLKEWDKRRKLQNQKLICPNCRNELPLEKWKKKLDYEENRKYETYIINKLNEYELNPNLNINDLKKVIEKYTEYIQKTFFIFKNISFLHLFSI